MELFIRIKNGQAFEHPIFGDNFRDVFQHVDVENLPPEFARFERSEPPLIGVYEVYEGVTYERRGDVFTDVHQVRQMTEEEKLEKKNQAMAEWADSGLASWIFSDLTCTFEPPFPKPNDGKRYRWDELTISWVEVPATQEKI